MMYDVKTIFLLTVVFVFHVEFSFAQKRDSVAMYYASTMRMEDMKKRLYTLSSDAFEGRETGLPGQKKAAQYIADFYKSADVLPGNKGDYFQTFPLIKETFEKSTLQVGSSVFRFIRDFYFFNSFSVQQDISLSDAVFCGYGIEDSRYSDFKHVNIKNKVAVVLFGEPMSEDGKSKITGSTDLSEWSVDASMKVELAKSKGAKAIIFILSDYDQFVPRVRYWLESATLKLEYPESGASKKTLPFFFVSPRVAREMLDTSSKNTLESVIKKISEKGKTVTLKLKTTGLIHVERSAERFTSENVLGFVEGSDSLLKNEVVVISAHYDHIGIVNGEINNGADDDGSGTVTVMEMARAFSKAKKEGHGTKRSLLFLHVSGEEKGLLGSEWYTEFPVYPLENTVCDLNIDMIGRKDEQHENDSNYVYLIGSDKLSTQLHAISEEANKKYTRLKLDYTFNDPNDPNRFYYRSDHYNFAKHNIPVIFYFSGVHEDYHKPGDDPEKILYERMTTIGRLIFYTAWEVANQKDRIAVDVINDFEHN